MRVLMMGEKAGQKCDEVNEWIQKMKTADGIILSSPVHYAALMKLVEHGKGTVTPPPREVKTYMSFIR